MYQSPTNFALIPILRALVGVLICCALSLAADADYVDAPEIELEPADSVSVEAPEIESEVADSALPDAPEIELENALGEPAEEVIGIDESEDAPEIELEEAEGSAEVQEKLPPIEKVPEVVKQVEADYPQEIYKEGIQGSVLLDVILSDSGTVDSVAVARGVHPVLDSSAAAALRQYLFTPAIADGEPVPVLIQYEYAFTLREIVEKVEKYVNFRGKLLERGTRMPIADAMVVLTFVDTVSDTTLDVPFSAYRSRIGEFEGQYLEEDRLVTVTDSAGEFRFYSIPACTVEVAAPLPGYEELREREVVNLSEELDVTYRVARISYSDYEIVVYGKAEKKEVSRRQLTLHEVKKIPGLGGDAVKVVQALPGVARPTFGSSQVVVRGAGTADSRFFLDGVEIPLLFHFGGLKSTYNSDALESVDFYPGGWNTRYGGAVAGVVEITGRKPKTDRWHGYVDANFTDGTVFVEGPIGDKVSVLGEYRRSFIGDLIKFGTRNFPSTAVLTTAPYYWDYILRTDLDIDANNHAYLTAFGVKDGVELIVSDVRGGSDEVSDAKNTVRSELLFHMGLLGWDWNVSKELKNTARASVAYVEANASVFGFARVTQDYLQLYFRDQLSYAPSERALVNLGVDLQTFPFDMYFRIPNEKNQIEIETTEDWWFGVLGGYLNCEFRPTDKWLIIPGLRYDIFPELDYHGAMFPEFWDYQNDQNTTRFSGEPSLRLTTRYEAFEGHTFKASAGNYSQSPEPLGQSIHEDFGDPALGATRAAQYVGGYEWQITDLLHLDLQGYYNQQWHVPRSVFGEPPMVGDGKRRMYGAELMLRHDQSDRFFGWLAYSLSRSENWSYPKDDWVLYGKDQTHNLIALGSWRLPRNWEVGFKIQFTTGDPETPVVGARYVENDRQFEPIYGETNSSRLDPTFQLDLRIDKKFVFKNWIASAYVDFFNIGYFLYKSPQMSFYNYQYYDYPNRRADRRFANQYSLPSIGLRGEF